MTSQTIVSVGINEGDFRGADYLTIQSAIDSLPLSGGTVRLLPGRYSCPDSVRIRSNITLQAEPRQVVLFHPQSQVSSLAIDADYGQTKVTVSEPEKFKSGMGVYVCDNNSAGWTDSVSSVVRVEGAVVYLTAPLISDYQSDLDGKVVADSSLISGTDIQNVTLAGLVLQGDCSAGMRLDGCRAGAIYLHRAKTCTIRDCVVKGFQGDGYSLQITQDISVENCEAHECLNFGFHPGTGSTRMRVSNCRFTTNRRGGFFLCWRVQESFFENIVCENNAEFGISIGHRDSHNVFSHCVMRRNGKFGLRFRPEKEQNGAHENHWIECVIDDNAECGIEYNGRSLRNEFERCLLQDDAEKLTLLEKTAAFCFK